MFPETTAAISKSDSKKAQPRIMVVDDDPDITMIVKRALNIAGYTEVIAFNNPIEVLANFEIGKYDLIVLDIQMPQMSGYDLYRQIRTIDGKVKVCFISAYEYYQEEFIKQFPNDVMGCFVKKPITMAGLIAKIKERLG
jgi:two-component system alkaline phosphatase synthesis response regulator PhoP